MRQDSAAYDPEKHINAYAISHGIPYRYKDLINWLENGDDYGDPVTQAWLRKRFAPVTKPTMKNWLQAIELNKKKR